MDSRIRFVETAIFEKPELRAGNSQRPADARNTRRRSGMVFIQMLLSIKAVNWDFDTAPTLVASTSPSLNSISVGIPRMP